MMQPMYAMQNHQDLMLAQQQAMAAQYRLGQIAWAGVTIKTLGSLARVWVLVRCSKGMYGNPYGMQSGFGSPYGMQH
jgi:hypothetical protein